MVHSDAFSFHKSHRVGFRHVIERGGMCEAQRKASSGVMETGPRASVTWKRPMCS